MPVLAVAAIAYAASSVVTTFVLAAGFSALAATALGAVASIAVSSLVGQAFSDKPKGQNATSASFEQELQDNLVTVRQPITHWQWIYGRVRVGGALTFAHESADGNTHLIITLAGHVSEEIEEVWFNDQLVPLDGSGNATGTYAGYARVLKSLGDEAGQPFPALVAESEGKWTDAHRQTGRTKIYVRLTPNPNVFPTGIPNVTCVVKGKLVYDPRTDTTAWSDNASLCIADLLCSQAWLGCTYADEIDEDQLIAAANIDDEAVALAAGGTEARYTMNGAFSVNVDTRTALNQMLSANAGRVHHLGGLFRILPAAYVSPTITLDEDDLRGVPQIEPRLSSSDLCNRVKGVYVSEDNRWQPSDFPPVTNATYLAEDNGEASWRELDLPFTKSPATAQRIAKIELERVRQQISVNWPGKFNCYRLQPGDTVQITFSMLGWSAKVFEVVATALVVEEDGQGGVRLGCNLQLRETAAAVFDWSSGEETTVDPAPDTNLPDPLDVPAPGAPTVEESKYETRIGRGVASLVALTVATPTAPNWRAIQFEYRRVGDTLWTVIPPSEALTVAIPDIPPATYDFRAKVISQLGVSSDYATTRKEIIGLYDTPPDATIRGLQIAGNLALLSVEQCAELDVRRGGRVLVRHAESVLEPPWEESFSIGDANGYAGDSTILVLPLKPGWYLVKFEDAVGKQSVNAVAIATKQAAVLEYSTVDTLQEDSAFPGTHSGTVAADGLLKLAALGSFDDIVDFDLISSLDNFGGVEASGTYTFSAGFNFGAVTRVRITGQLGGLTVNVNDRIDDRTDNIDTWLSFDGTGGGGSTDAWLEIRETDDNPLGTPTWGEWKRLDSAEFECWGAQLRAQLRAYDASYNQHLDRLGAVAEEVT